MTTPTLQQRDQRTALLLALIGRVTTALATTWEDLAAAQTMLLTALTGMPHTHRAGSTPAAVRAALDDFRAATARFDQAAAALVTRWAAVDLPIAYRAGAEEALRRAVFATGWARAAFTWSAEHQAAVTALSADFYAALLARVTEAVRRAQAFQRAVAAAARQAEPPDPEQLADAHPLGTVIYADDSRHPAAAWAAAALAAQALTAANTAAARAARSDLAAQWVEITDGAECGWTAHDDPDLAAGTIRSVDDAETYPIAHPGCLRQIIPRPDLTTGWVRDGQWVPA